MTRNTVYTVAIVALIVIGIAVIETKRAIRETPITDSDSVTEGNYAGISSQGLQERIKRNDDFILVDVRRPVEYMEGHIIGAMNIPVAEMEKELGKLDGNKEIILYCKSGPWSRQAYKILHANGFKNVKVLANGIVGWKWEVNGKVTPTH